MHGRQLQILTRHYPATNKQKLTRPNFDVEISREVLCCCCWRELALNVGLFSKQKLLKVRFGCGVVASLRPLPATLHEGQRHLLAAVGATVRVGAEVIPHCLGGTWGEAKTGLCLDVSALQSRVAGQPCTCDPRGPVSSLAARFWPPPLVEPGAALLSRWQVGGWTTFLNKQRWRWLVPLLLCTSRCFLVLGVNFTRLKRLCRMKPGWFGKAEVPCRTVMGRRTGRVPLQVLEAVRVLQR